MLAAVALVPEASAQVSFEATTPLMLDFDELAEDAGRIKVMVRNDSPDDQQVEVRLVGLAASADAENPNLKLIGPTGTVSERIGSGKSEELVLLLNTNARPDPGSYEATLIAASGVSPDVAAEAVGGLATVNVAGRVSWSPDEQLDPRLDPQTIADFSVEGTSFVPSLITPMPALFLGAGVLVFLTLVPFLGLPQSRLIGPAFLVGFIIFLAGLLWSSRANDNYYGGPIVSVVQVNPVPATPEADKGAVGTLVAKDGSTAQATVDNGELLVENVARAGAYTGKIDLLKGIDTGAATMTANVRDFWPYAFVVIGLGVVLGYRITRYFTRIRGKEKLEIDSEELRREVFLSEAEFSRQVTPELYERYRFRRLFDARLGVIRRLLGNDEPSNTEEAGKKLQALRSYSDQVIGLWAKLVALSASLREIEVLARDEFELRTPSDVYAVRQVRNVLDHSLDDGQSADENEGRLKARHSEVDAATTLIETFLRYLGSVRDYRQRAAATKTDKAHQAKLEKLRGDLTSAARKLVTATDESEMKQASSEAYKVWLQIEELGKKVKPPAELASMTFLEDWLIGEAGAMEFLRDEGLVELAQPGAPTATISVRIARPEGNVSSADGDRDDFFVFTADVTIPADLTPTATAHWDFGDNTRSVSFDLLSARDETKLTISVLHRYADHGEFKVRLYDDKDQVIGEAPIRVAPGLTRLERRRESFLLTDRRMTIASGLLAVFSGLVALYATSATWGTPGDYLKALLWGTVVSEGVKQVTALVARTGPPS
jgi:hypothetical protein